MAVRTLRNNRTAGNREIGHAGAVLTCFMEVREPCATQGLALKGSVPTGDSFTPAVVMMSWPIRSILRGRETSPPMTETPHDVGRALLEGAISCFRANKGWADKAIAQVPDDRLRVALDPNTNSIAVIMKHVAGNLLSRWTEFLTTDGEKPWRNRDDEFVDTFANRGELLACWESGWQRLFETLESLTADDLGRSVTIRGEALSVPLAIQRSLAHCGYHVGQIILIARVLAGEQWTTITIPRGGSSGFNQAVWGQGHYQSQAKPGEELS